MGLIHSSFQVSASIILGIAAILLTYGVLSKKKDSSTRKYPPGPRGWPFFGNILTMLLTKLEQHQLLTKWTREFGPIYTFKMFNSRVVILSDAKLSQEVFQGPDVTDRLPFFACDRAHGREFNGVAFSNGRSWTEQRRFFHTVFRKVDIGVEKFEDIISSQTQHFLAELEKTNGESFDPENLINISIANIITRIVTGVTYEYDDAEFQRVIACSGRLFDTVGPAGLYSLIPVLAQLPVPMNWEINRLSKEILVFISKSIEDHRKAFNPNEPPTDFIGCYLKEMADRSEESRGSFDDINLKQSCFDALLGGWETVATNLRWAFFTLAQHPEAQARVRDEIYEVVGQDRLPTIASRPKLPLTEATIAECMRYVPGVPSHLPHIVTKDCKIGGYDVPKGTAVTTNLWFLATSPILWDKPEEFRPERFLDANGAFDKKLEPLLFGTGRRVCPGEQMARMELFIFMTYILQRYVLKLPERAPTTVDGILGLTYRPRAYKIQAVRVE